MKIGALHRTNLTLLLAIMAVLLWASASIASIIDLTEGTSEEHKGSFTGTLNYTVVDATHGALDVCLTNTSPAANGGYIVAFVFNNPGDQISGVQLTTTSRLTKLLGGGSFQDTVKARPYDNFDIGVALGGNNKNGFEGTGGSPKGGIAVGSTATFIFDLTGIGLDTLTTRSFVDAIDSDGIFMAVRFKGFKDGFSDKCTVHASQAPIPGAVWLLGSGLAGLAIYHKRRAAAKG